MYVIGCMSIDLNDVQRKVKQAIKLKHGREALYTLLALQDGLGVSLLYVESTVSRSSCWQSCSRQGSTRPLSAQWSAGTTCFRRTESKLHTCLSVSGSSRYGSADALYAALPDALYAAVHAALPAALHAVVPAALPAASPIDSQTGTEAARCAAGDHF